MSDNEGIPIRRLVVHDPKDTSVQYSETPGGSLFSTTPGGTRIYYDRAFLLSRRGSSMTRSPPANLPYIPEVTLIPEIANDSNVDLSGQQGSNSVLKKNLADDQFTMDM